MPCAAAHRPGHQGRADERLVGLLQVLLKALDPAELRVSGPDGGPIPIAAVIANVQSALGMRPAAEASAVEPDATSDPPLTGVD